MFPCKQIQGVRKIYQAVKQPLKYLQVTKQFRFYDKTIFENFGDA